MTKRTALSFAILTCLATSTAFATMANPDPIWNERTNEFGNFDTIAFMGGGLGMYGPGPMVAAAYGYEQPTSTPTGTTPGPFTPQPYEPGRWQNNYDPNTNTYSWQWVPNPMPYNPKEFEMNPFHPIGTDSSGTGSTGVATRTTVPASGQTTPYTDYTRVYDDHVSTFTFGKGLRITGQEFAWGPNIAQPNEGPGPGPMFAPMGANAAFVYPGPIDSNSTGPGLSPYYDMMQGFAFHYTLDLDPDYIRSLIPTPVNTGTVVANAVIYDNDDKQNVSLLGYGGTTISNLKAGEVSPTSMQAVNGSQLYATNQAVAQNTTAIANLNNRVDGLSSDIEKSGAATAALASLKPIQYDPLEPNQIMGGIGHYKGSTAAAIGLAHYTNESTMFHIGASLGGGNTAIGAGVTHKFGFSEEKKAIPERYKAGPISSVYVMQDEVNALKEENAKLRKQNEETQTKLAAVMAKLGM